MSRPRVRVLTPTGRGAVAVVGIRGPGALAVADSAFRPHRGARLVDTPRGRLRLGRMGSGLGDEVVAVVLAGEAEEVEIQCHGGLAPRALVVEALVAAGADLVSAETWTRSVSGSRLEAEARLDLARASTVRTAEILLDQARGTLAAEVRGVAHPAMALDELDDLIRRAEVGLNLVSGWKVVLAGRPNVGKSRLFNALAGYDRAIVAPTPGTTRDVVTARTALEGWPVELADTAGLRESDDPIESAGVALARASQGEADLILLVLDRSEPLTAADSALLDANRDALVTANKADLPAAWDPARLDVASVSAEGGEGIEDLALAIARRLVPEPPSLGLGVPFRDRQVRLLQRARRWLAAGQVAPALRALQRVVG